MKTLPTFLVLVSLLSTGATAQTSGVPIPLAPAVQHETSISLDVGFGVRAVPSSRVTVPVGEKLRVTAPVMGDGVTYIWTKNGQALPGAPSSNVLTIEFVRSDDAGVYTCLFSRPTTLPQPSQALVLGVGPTDRLLNLSARGTLGSDGPALTIGFVVAAAPAPGKKLIIRAIGPSLGAFGVSDPLRQPILRIYDAAGRLYENAYVYPPVVGGPTYESDLAESLARSGAFPVPPNSGDIVAMKPFLPGSYTATVTSGDGGGTVLLEIYEVP